jgi:hypothetical protein
MCHGAIHNYQEFSDKMDDFMFQSAELLPKMYPCLVNKVVIYRLGLKRIFYFNTIDSEAAKALLEAFAE